MPHTSGMDYDIDVFHRTLQSFHISNPPQKMSKPVIIKSVHNVFKIRFGTIKHSENRWILFKDTGDESLTNRRPTTGQQNVLTSQH